MQTGDVVKQILRMSQKALGWTLAMIGVGYIGGMIAICILPDRSDALRDFANIFTPVWTVEIGMYGIGSTLENLQKVKTQINAIDRYDQNTNVENG